MSSPPAPRPFPGITPMSSISSVDFPRRQSPNRSSLLAALARFLQFSPLVSREFNQSTIRKRRKKSSNFKPNFIAFQEFSAAISILIYFFCSLRQGHKEYQLNGLLSELSHKHKTHIIMHTVTKYSQSHKCNVTRVLSCKIVILLLNA